MEMNMPYKDLQKRKEYSRLYNLKHGVEYRKKNREINNTKSLEYYYKHKQEIKEYRKKYRESNYQKIREREIGQTIKRKDYHREYAIKNNHKYYIEHYEELATYRKQYKEINRETLNEKRKEKYSLNLNFRLSCRLRARLSHSIRNNHKMGSGVSDLGCSIDEFIKYLENQFLDGMDWGNYGHGVNKWNIDHIVPLLSVDLTDREQLLKVCHYSNLRPLWMIDNLKKGNRIENI